MSNSAGKPGRNDKCWCGSGEKYKHCHLPIEEGKPISKGDLAQVIGSRLVNSQKLCMHPEAGASCSNTVIKAHSVQRGGGLSRIARRGEVYYFREDVGGLVNSPRRILPKLVGYRNASTFTGFCGSHDSLTFRPIDDVDFSGEVEQIFLLGYRALCRELFQHRHKKESFADYPRLLRGAPRDIQELAREEEALVDYNLSEVERHKRLYDACLTAKDFSDVASYVLWTDRTPDVLCGASLTPWCDFSGKILQQIPNPAGHLQHCAFSIIASGNRGAVVFSWFKQLDTAMKQLVDSLDSLPDADLADAVLRFAFEHSNNVCFSPTWWEALPPATREALIVRAQSGYLNPRHVDCLRDDSIRAAAFKVVRQTNSTLQK